MSRFKHNILLQTAKLINVLMILVPFACCWFLYYRNHVQLLYYSKGNLTILFLFAFLYYILAKLYDGLQLSLQRISEMIYSQTLAFLITDAVMYIVICLLAKGAANILPGLACIAGQFILSAVWSFTAHQWYFKTFAAQRSAVIYQSREGLETLIESYGLSKKFTVELTMQVRDCLSDLSVLDGFDTVFLSGVSSHERNIILKYCVERGVGLYIIPRIGDVIMSGARRMHMFHLPMLRVERYNPAPAYQIVKRFFDILISLLMLIVLSPLLLVTAAAIKLTDRGPVFYCQTRLTKDGREFRIIKFRSMRVDAEKDGVARLSTGDADDRITPVGRLIRKCRIDELPQLINVLKGDMAICGPRPERPEIAAQYEAELPEFRLRLQVKAGLTGYAQVYGKYNTTPYDKLVMDLMYISHPSFAEDLRIIFATVKILFIPDSTEGVEKKDDSR